MKKIYKLLILLFIFIGYFIFGKITGLYFKCFIYELTGYHCPGCGITRMFFSLFRLDIYQAFRYNPLVFIMLPFILFFYFEKIYSIYKNKKALVDKVPNIIWYIVIFITLLYGVLRNIIPWLAPTVIK